MPPEALKAFRELQSYLCSEPIVDYPRRTRPYALIVHASLGDNKKRGGPWCYFDPDQPKWPALRHFICQWKVAEA